MVIDFLHKFYKLEERVLSYHRLNFYSYIMPKTLLILAPLPHQTLEELADSFTLIKLYESQDAGSLLAKNRENVRALIAGEKSRVSKALLDQLPNLELICIPLSALETVDEKACEGRNIKIISIGYIAPADYAETALALLFGLSKRLVEVNMMYRTGHWRASTRRMGKRLSGKSVALFGDAIIQGTLASSLTALGCTIIHKEEQDTLKNIAIKSDIFILLPGLSSGLFQSLDYEVIENIGKEGFLISLAGLAPLPVEDILAALNNRTLGGLAVDSYAQYDDVPKALLELDNIILTPGIAGSTLEAAEEFGQCVLKTLTDHFAE